MAVDRSQARLPVPTHPPIPRGKGGGSGYLGGAEKRRMSGLEPLDDGLVRGNAPAIVVVSAVCTTRVVKRSAAPPRAIHFLVAGGGADASLPI